MWRRANRGNHGSPQGTGRPSRRDAKWLWAGKAYVAAHAFGAGSMTVLSLCDCRIGYDWLPRGVYCVIHWVAAISFLPFLMSAPIAAVVMTFALSHRDREWLYLGVCDWSLLLLHLVAAAVSFR